MRCAVGIRLRTRFGVVVTNRTHGRVKKDFGTGEVTSG